MEMHQWEKAKQYCEMGLALIGKTEDMAYQMKVLLLYRSDIAKALDNLPTDIAEVCMKSVKNAGDELLFVYTAKAASTESPPRNVAPLQPEILVVDLDESMPIQEMFKSVYPDKVREWTHDPDTLEKGDSKVFHLPDTKYWVTVIPVWCKEDIRVIQSCLMCDCMKDSKIIILKLEEAEEPPVVDTAAYVADVVKNAHKCEKMYSKGHKLAE